MFPGVFVVWDPPKRNFSVGLRVKSTEGLHKAGIGTKGRV